MRDDYQISYRRFWHDWWPHIRRALRIIPVLSILIIGTLLVAGKVRDYSVNLLQGKAPSSDEPIIAAFKKTYPASVSDAVELVTGKNGTMGHDMKPYIGGAMVGRAVTSLVRPAPPEQATPALSTKHSVEMIDNAKPGEVGVIVMEGTLDIAAMGNLMATAAKVRGMAGMVLDGAIRDIWDVRRMGLTVYARSASPRTAVGHYATVANNIEVNCGGVMVKPGDILVADEDGVVVVPQERAEEVLKKAQEIDAREKGMFPFIRQFKSLTQAIEKFNRI
jgi:regulator of RNase E activity RraA